MVETGNAFIRRLVDEHLAQEIASGDPKRIRRAKIAQAANNYFGLGRWGQAAELSRVGPQGEPGTVIIPLVGLQKS